jgi:DNA-binding FadR family transcriptional regulator
MDILENITPCQRFAVSRAEEIARKVEALILDRAVKPGTSLGTKENLRHRFDVSPATMNEAIRLLQVRDVIVTRRGLNGGVFVATSRVQRTFHALVFERNPHALLIQQCQAVSNQLEPLIFAEAAKVATASAVADLRHLVHNIAASADEPTESLRWSWLLYRRIVDIGLSTVLTSIYSTLLTYLEQAVGQSVGP